METSEKIYLANMKASEKFGNGIISGALCIEELKELLEQDQVKALIYEYEGMHYLNINVIEMKKANQFGKTHYMEIDTWIPEGKRSNRVAKQKPAKSSASTSEKKAA